MNYFNNDKMSNYDSIESGNGIPIKEKRKKDNSNNINNLNNVNNDLEQKYLLSNESLYTDTTCK